MLVRSPTLTKRLSSVIVSGSRPDRRITGWCATGSRRALPSTAAAIAAMWSGVVPQQPPTKLRKPASANSARTAAVWSGVSSYSPKRVGQPGVGVDRDEGVGQARELGDVGAHVARAERAVEADGQRASVPDRVPEGLGDLAGERPAGRVGDRAGDDHRPAAALLLEERLDREDRGLGVEGVEDRLDHQQVGAAVDQAAGRVEVGVGQLVEGDVAGAGVVDVGRDGRGARRRTRVLRRPSAGGRRSPPRRRPRGPGARPRS